jgi:hypothetical protein
MAEKENIARLWPVLSATTVGVSTNISPGLPLDRGTNGQEPALPCRNGL